MTNFLTNLLYLSIIGNLIKISQSETILCDSTNCKFQTLGCSQSGSICQIDCTKDDQCAGLTFNCLAGEDCVVNCNGTGKSVSCNGINVNALNANNLYINALSDTSASNSVINCPINGNCTVNCSSRESCFGTKVDATFSKSLTLNTKSSCCGSLSVYCPKAKNGCHINSVSAGSSQWSNMRVKAEKGFSDVKFNCPVSPCFLNISRTKINCGVSPPTLSSDSCLLNDTYNGCLSVSVCDSFKVTNSPTLEPTVEPSVNPSLNPTTIAPTAIKKIYCDAAEGGLTLSDWKIPKSNKKYFFPIFKMIKSEGIRASTYGKYCPHYPFYSCAEVYGKAVFYRYLNLTGIKDIKFSYDFRLGYYNSYDRDEYHEIQYNCLGDWFTLVRRGSATASDQAYLDKKYILPSACNNNPKVGIKFIQTASIESLFLNNICISGSVSLLPIKPTTVPTIKPSYIPTPLTVSPSKLPAENKKIFCDAIDSGLKFSDWKRSGHITSSWFNTYCPDYPNQCVKMDGRAFFYRYFNLTQIKNIEFSYDFRLGYYNSYERMKEYHEIRYNCLGNWETLVRRGSSTSNHAYLDNRYMLPSVCDNNPKVGIKFIQIASIETLYLNNICISGQRSLGM